jgi:hypothetical protein
MIVFVLLVLIIIIASLIWGVVNDGRDWIRGVDYDDELHGNAWVIARMIADADKQEFIVKYNTKDNHFYDKEGTGYHITEIYIKVENK